MTIKTIVITHETIVRSVILICHLQKLKRKRSEPEEECEDVGAEDAGLFRARKQRMADGTLYSAKRVATITVRDVALTLLFCAAKKGGARYQAASRAGLVKDSPAAGVFGLAARCGSSRESSLPFASVMLVV
jgi:hypothetical protein